MSPETLVSQARKLHEVWAAGTPPVMMRAEIRVFDGKGGVTPGQYIVNWISPVRWREELRFVNYERVRVHDAKGYWQKSGLDFRPEIIFQLDRVLNSESKLKIGPKQNLGKVKSRDKDGVRQSCTEEKSAKVIDRILCFDEANGNLVTIEYPRNDNQNPPDISRIEYRAFRNVGEKRLPFEIQAFRDKKVFATVRVMELRAIVDENPSLLVAPTNSEFWAECNDMEKAELVNPVHPDYPHGARMQHESGTVTFYAVIEADGTVSHLTLIHGATPILESATADAIRQWHYKPAACGSTPVRVEIVIATYFHVEY